MMRRALAIAATVAALVLLAGCGTPDPRPTRPPASAEGGGDLTNPDLSGWRITEQGVGDVHLGDTVFEVAEATGVPIALYGEPECGVYSLAGRGSLAQFTVIASLNGADGPIDWVTVSYYPTDPDSADSLAMYARLPALDTGIRVGDPESTVKAAYADGSHGVYEHAADTQGHTVTDGDHLIRIWVDPDSRAVTSIGTGRVDSLPCGGD